MRQRIIGALAGAAILAGVVGAVGVTTAPAQAQTAKDPVVIVGGFLTGEPIASVFYAPLAARLRADGYQTYIFGPVDFGTADIRTSAAALNTFVDGVRASTGAARVDLIGHSQGGLTSRYYIKNLGGAAEVDSMISLSSLHYGTAVASLGTFLGLGNCLGIVGCAQMAIGSSFLNDLNAGDDTIGSVTYTNFATIWDELVIPYSSGFLHNDGNVTNLTVQSQCPFEFVEHAGVALNATVYSGVVDALRHERIRLSC
jgi:triacylglycerol esterase/lipase EstA (alpha/beta hydrolase family)